MSVVYSVCGVCTECVVCVLSEWVGNYISTQTQDKLAIS